MNAKQKLVIWIGIGLFVIMGLFPPWYSDSYSKKHYSEGYHFINHYSGNSSRAEYRIDKTLLHIQWTMVIVAVVGFVLTLKGTEEDSKRPLISNPELKRIISREWRIFLLTVPLGIVILIADYIFSEFYFLFDYPLFLYCFLPYSLYLLYQLLISVVRRSNKKTKRENLFAYDTLAKLGYTGSDKDKAIIEEIMKYHKIKDPVSAWNKYIHSKI